MRVAKRRSHLTGLEVEIFLAVRIPDLTPLASRDDGPIFETAHIGRPLRREHVLFDDPLDLFLLHARLQIYAYIY